MKKYLSTILITVMILGIVGGAFVPQEARADGLLATAATQLLPTTSWANTMIAYIGQAFLTVTSVFVTATATFLSVSINLTTHIKDIYEKIDGIKIVWTTVRDLSSLLIIFMLLYYSILTIVGQSDQKIGKLILNIFLAGVFINFSLFFVRVAVDASNLVSLQFYNAIAPKTENNGTIASAFSDGGLSNVLLQSLKVQTVYKSATVKGGLDIGTGIIFATIGGIMIMITTAFSLLAAAIAFTARTALLLFIMAVSPVFFAGMIFPELKAKISDPILNLLKGQLIFMPVYLFFMYVALKIISDPKFNGIFSDPSGVNSSTASYAYVWTGIIIQYIIALLFINLPLIAAISLGGKGMKWAPDLKGISKWTGGFAGQHTFGRAAKLASDKLAKSDFAAKNPNLAVLANKGLGKVSGATFLGSKGGYDARYKDYVKNRTEFGNKNIKLSEEDKKAAITTGLSSWDIDTKNLQDKLEAAKNRSSERSLTSESEKMKARKRAAEYQLEIEARKKAYNTGTQDKYLEAAALKERKEAYAENLEKQSKVGFFTNKARKEAAKSLREEMNKSEDKKLLEKLQKLAKDADKEEKPEGGEKPKT